jgi:hypothetical protein
MNNDGQAPTEIEHAELIDMRTHLTVAVLAASQLHRKTKDLPEATHLQCYLDQSLKRLVDDVGKVDALIAHVEAQERRRVKAENPHGPKVLRGLFALLKRGVHVWGVCAQRWRYSRLTALYLYR